jgi:hypothetical protein
MKVKNRHRLKTTCNSRRENMKTSSKIRITISSEPGGKRNVKIFSSCVEDRDEMWGRLQKGLTGLELLEAALQHPLESEKT